MLSRKTAAFLYIQAILLQIAWSGARLMIGFAALSFTRDPLLLGLVAATYAAPAIAFALPTGVLMDRFGASRIVTVGVVAALGACCAAALAPGLVVLIAANAVLGLGQLLCMVGQQGYVVERSDGTRMDAALGNLTSAMSVGQLIGPLAVALIGTIGVDGSTAPNTLPGLLFCALCVLIALPCGLVLARVPYQRMKAARPRLAAAAKDVLTIPSMWRALAVSGVVLATVDLLYVFLPAWAAENGQPAVLVGVLLSTRAAITVVSRLGMGRILARTGRKALLVACLGMGVVGFICLLTGNVVIAFAAMAILGIALGLPQPLTISWVVSRAPVRIRGAALGLRVTSNRLVQVALPILVGAVATPIGTAGAFIGAAVFLGGAAIVTATAGDSLGDERARDV